MRLSEDELKRLGFAQICALSQRHKEAIEREDRRSALIAWAIASAFGGRNSRGGKLTLDDFMLHGERQPERQQTVEEMIAVVKKVGATQEVGPEGKE